MDCEGASDNCTKCGIINGKTYYLNDTDLTDVAVGGVCVLDCTGAYYQNDLDYTCSRCQEGCQSC